jgi:pilus assembly protein Flp/PilA
VVCLPSLHYRSLMMEMMTMKARKLIRRLAKDEEGATLIEYTALLAILLVAVIAVITGVGTWINAKWTAVNAALP